MPTASRARKSPAATAPDNAARLALAPERHTVRLVSLKLDNFRAARELSLAFPEGNAVLAGRNGKGKTTVYDAWCWLVTGKDSHRRADGDLKPFDERGEPVHNLDMRVTAELLVDGEPVSLRRTLREQWAKKRGSVTPEFTGHTTEYAVNGVPAPEREWRERVAALLVPEREFWLLTDYGYFASGLRWQDRRELVLQVAGGDVAMADVTASDPALERLVDQIGKLTVEEFRTLTAASLKETTRELDQLPARLDEARRALADTGAEDLDPDAMADCLARATRALDEARARRDRCGRDALAPLREQLATAERSLAMARTVREDNERLDATRRRRALQEAEEAVAQHERRLASASAERRRADAHVALLEREIADKRREWTEAYGQTVSPGAPAYVCGRCGFTPPPDAEDEARRNERRAETLGRLKAEGESLVQQRDREQTLLATCCDLTPLERAVQEARAAADTARTAASSPPAGEPDERERSLAAEVERLRAQLVEQGAANQVLEGAEAAVRSAEHALGETQQRQAMFVAAERARDRVEQLQARQREAGRQAAELLASLDLCDRYTIARVRLLEHRAAAAFGGLGCRMFERQVNGAMAECCEVLSGGVPFAELNHAGQVNVGRRCIGVLQEHFGAWLPAWVDARESVTDLAPIAAQTISLKVDPRAETLRVEEE